MNKPLTKKRSLVFFLVPNFSMLPFSAAIETLRIPVEYLAGLFTAGDPEPVTDVLRRLAAMEIQTIIDRITGCNNVLENYPDIKVVGHQASKNDRASGLMVTTDMLTANPGVKGIFGMNDPSALGAVLAVEQAGKSSNIIVTGVDGSPEGVAELKRKGSPFIGTATQNPGAMVEKAVAIASDMLNGKQPAEKTILIPSVLVTRDSVGQYPGW